MVQTTATTPLDATGPTIGLAWSDPSTLIMLLSWVISASLKSVPAIEGWKVYQTFPNLSLLVAGAITIAVLALKHDLKAKSWLSRSLVQSAEGAYESVSEVDPQFATTVQQIEHTVESHLVAPPAQTQPMPVLQPGSTQHDPPGVLELADGRRFSLVPTGDGA